MANAANTEHTFRVVSGARRGVAAVEPIQDLLEFSGVEIVTYCLMSNHIHLLVRVPGEVSASDEELVARALRFCGKKNLYVQTLQKALARPGALPEDLREGLRERMGDVSVFMKELTQRFSKWFNKERNRFGTLWAERFKSVLVEDQPGSASAPRAIVVI